MNDMSVQPPPLPTKPVTPIPVVRAPAVPPPLLRRIGLLCLRPQQWAEAARYRLSATLWPVVVVTLLVAMVMGLAAARRGTRIYDAFAADFDGRFFPVVLKDGKLSRVPATDGGKTTLAPPELVIQDMPFWSTFFRIGGVESVKVVFDPENKSRADMVGSQLLVRLTDSEMVMTQPGSDSVLGGSDDSQWRAPLPVGEEMSISGEQLRGAELPRTSLGISVFLATAFVGFFYNFLWALLVAFVLVPLIVMIAAPVGMPRYVAYRVGLAITVPLIALSGLLEATGLMSQTSMPVEVMPVIWLLAAAGMALWAALMANRMFSPRRAPRRGM